MLGEQLCQRVACLGYLCSSRQIQHTLLHQPQFSGLSFTQAEEMQKKAPQYHSAYSKFHLFSLASNFPLQCMWGTNWHHHHAAQETQQERQKESVQLTSWRGNTPDSFYSTWTDMPLLSLTLLSQYILNFNILSPPSGETIRLHQSCSPIRILWNLRNTSSVLATS